MNMFKKGPEIKLPDVKLPDFVLDVYYDLRERHLLPVALVLLVAIVAIPIALSQSSASEEREATVVAVPSSVAGQPRSSVLVARSAPGLRDYRKRLHHLRSKDPFSQQYTGTEQAGGGNEVASGGEEVPTTSEPAGSPAPEAPTLEPTPSSPGPEGHPGPGDLTYFSYAIDVRVVAGGSQQAEKSNEQSTASVRRNLPELTMLPSRETPAAIYMGATKDGKKALLMISSDVQAVFGDGVCVLGSKTCQLLAVEPGLPETFAYGPEGHTYKIELLKIHLVTTDKLNRAPLGKPKQSSKSKKGD
jgi:hypothetical protein